MLRRTFLSYLGLAPTIAIGSESFREPLTPQGVECGQQITREAFAKALRYLADGYENKSLEIVSIGLESDLKVDEIAKHTITIELIYFPEHEGS